MASKVKIDNAKMAYYNTSKIKYWRFWNLDMDYTAKSDILKSKLDRPFS